MNDLNTNDRFDRIERLLENLSNKQVTTQNQLDSVARHLDSLVSTAADMRTRQIITQNQIDSLAALSLDTRQALMVLLQTSVNHESRLDDLERGENEPNP
jgi:predicted transcriptional regulator